MRGEAGNQESSSAPAINKNLRSDVAAALNTDSASGKVLRRRSIVEFSDVPALLAGLGVPAAARTDSARTCPAWRCRRGVRRTSASASWWKTKAQRCPVRPPMRDIPATSELPLHRVLAKEHLAGSAERLEGGLAGPCENLKKAVFRRSK